MGLSADDVPNYEAKLQWVEQHLHLGEEALLKELVAFPSIQFGVEQAFRSVAASQWYKLFLPILQRVKTQFLSTDLFGWALPIL